MAIIFMTEVIKQDYWVRIRFPTTDRNLARVHKTADKYSHSCWGYLTDEGLQFAFSDEVSARDFIKKSKDLGFITDVELSRNSWERLPV